MRLGEKGRFRYAPALLLPQILNNFTSNYWPGFTPPQWPGFTPPLTNDRANVKLLKISSLSTIQVANFRNVAKIHNCALRLAEEGI